MFINVTWVKLVRGNGTSTSHSLKDLWNSSVWRWVTEVFSDGAERVLTEMLFHEDVSFSVYGLRVWNMLPASLYSISRNHSVKIHFVWLRLRRVRLLVLGAVHKFSYTHSLKNTLIASPMFYETDNMKLVYTDLWQTCPCEDGLM